MLESDLKAVAAHFAASAPAADYWTLRLVDEAGEGLAVRDDVAEPSRLWRSRGAMITVVAGGGLGYAASSDLSPSGLAQATQRAQEMAALHARLGLFAADLYPRSALKAQYAASVREPWASRSLDDKLGLLFDACRQLDRDPRLVERATWLSHRRTEQLLISADGAEIEQVWETVHSGLSATAHIDGQTQTRRGGGAEMPRQGGLERLTEAGFSSAAEQVADEAIALALAPECPSGKRDCS